LVSATVSEGTASDLLGSYSSGATGAYAGTDAEADAPASVTACLYAWTTSAVERYSEEKGGGRGELGGEDDEASEAGYRGGGDCARSMSSS
jgi:hypothetical protein